MLSGSASRCPVASRSRWDLSCLLRSPVYGMAGGQLVRQFASHPSPEVRSLGPVLLGGLNAGPMRMTTARPSTSCSRARVGAAGDGHGGIGAYRSGHSVPMITAGYVAPQASGPRRRSARARRRGSAAAHPATPWSAVSAQPLARLPRLARPGAPATSRQQRLRRLERAAGLPD